jgi:RNA recognition motif-containing protein
MIRIDFARGRKTTRTNQTRKFYDTKGEYEPLENTIFIGGLNFVTTREQLAQMFTPCGEILKINLPVSHFTKRVIYL